MADTHRLRLTSDPAGLLFECQDGCGRRLVVDRESGALTTIERGDPYALHRGSHTDVALAMPIVDVG